MSDMLEGLMKQIGGGDLLGKLSANLGVDEKTAKKGFGETVSGLLESVKQMGSTPDGQAKLQAAIDSSDDKILDDPTSALSGDGGQKTLDDVFGGGNDIAQKVSSSSGLPVGQIMKLLPVVLPLLLGFLKKFMGGKNMDMNGLMGVLGDEGGGGIFAKIKSLFS